MNFKEQLVFQINVINRRLTAATNRLLDPSGLETSSFFLLCYLNEKDVTGTGSLERILKMERTTLSRSFSVLAKNGYCTSTKKSGDKRVAFHVITRRGKALVEAYAKPLAEFQKSFLSEPVLSKIAEVFKDVG